MRSVLVIEDDLDLANLLSLHLRDIGCQVELQDHGQRGLDRALERPFGLVVLDLMLPGRGGMEICRTLRMREGYIPILMLTARSTELDRVHGLEAGADDYLTKPFSILEFIARVKALFRRTEALSARRAPIPGRIRVGAIEIDRSTRDVSVRGRRIQLTAKEFDLLLHLASHPGRVFTRQALLSEVWGGRYSGFEHTVNSHINRLRSKIEDDPRAPEHILTVWSVGYKLADPDTSEAS